MDVIRDYYNERKGARNSTIAHEYFGNGYSGIKSWKAEEYQGLPPARDRISWELAGSAKFKDVLIDRYVLRHSGMLEMPLLHIHRSSAGKKEAVLWFDKNGKAKSANWGEIEKYVDAGYDVISFDFRGLGETRMPYKAISPDDPAMAQLDFDQAYTSPLSSVLAGYVYNSVLTGRPYFLQMIEDAEIAGRFAQEKFGVRVSAVTAPGEAFSLAKDISETLPGIGLLHRQTHSPTAAL